MEFVTVQESHNISDLLVLKSKLESEGIHCFLKDEFATTIMTHIPSITVKLQIPASEVEKVKIILAELEK